MHGTEEGGTEDQVPHHAHAMGNSTPEKHQSEDPSPYLPPAKRHCTGLHTMGKYSCGMHYSAPLKRPCEDTAVHDTTSKPVIKEIR